MSSSLTLDKFDCEGDPTSVGARWDRWKRALNIYLEAAEIDTNEKKKASLLHFGGIDLQEIFYNIPGANVEPQEGVDVFKVALTKLDSYFAPKQNKLFERHVFRLIKQEPDEKFEKFIIRLRKQADKCYFKDKDEAIIDQVTEKCLSTELRKKILQTGDDITVDKIILEANTLEAVNKQMEDFSAPSKTNFSVNKVEEKYKRNFERSKKATSGCTRCGNPRHWSNDPKCPAREKTCLKCSLKGHFRQFCRTVLPLKRKSSETNTSDSNYKRQKTNENTINQVQEQTTKKTQYIFHIDDDVEFECTIGGVQTKVLIDSGCKQNLITAETWETMKNKDIDVRNQIAKPDVTFMAYGNDSPLNVLGAFEAEIKIGSKSHICTFYVIENGTRNLLGKQSAMAMGILKIGIDLEINNVGIEIFPKFKNANVELPIDPAIPAISQPHRRIPIPLEEKVEEKINELIRRDIIEEVKGSSRWVSPIVPILKDNGEVRLCVDMRRANEAIIRENHPLPTMDKLLPKIKGAKYYTKLDIKDAFHQIEIEPGSRHITTFITSKGLYRYKRLMFGISCAPEIFQKTLEKMLLGCEGVINYIDDILVFGRDLEEHDTRLAKVLAVLKDHNVVLREDKCRYKMTKVEFLGHELSGDGIRPLEKYIGTIQGFRPPTTVGELQSFLGLVNFVSKWIPDFATQTEPMKKLLRNKLSAGRDITSDWGPEQQRSFENLKLALANVPTLGYYDVKDRTILWADASPVGLGAVLIQINEQGPRVIAYGHKTLTECERRYCQTEKEGLALVWAVEHFHIFLFGKRFELVTDHKPLEVIFGPKSKPCARIERWVLRLQSYAYTVVYKPGKDNIADPLSRLSKFQEIVSASKTDHVHQIVEYTRPIAVSLNEIMEHSANDPEILQVKEGLYNNNWHGNVRTYKVFQTELCFYDDILLRGNKIVIPENLRQRVLDAAHEGHPGIVAMKGRLRTKVWWPGCDKDAERVVKSCQGCILVSGPNPPNPMKRRTLPEEPWVDVAIDLLGPLPGNEWLLVIVDYYSRYKEIKICHRITTGEMTSHLEEIFSRVGYPGSITADNGKQFCSNEFKDYCRERNITLFNTIPYWPQQNGEVERQNRDILKRIKISQVEKQDWKACLLQYLVMYNSTPHSTTGATPSELFFKRKFRDKIPMINDVNRSREDDMEMRDADQESKAKGKEYADRKRKAKPSELEPGDKVYIKNMNRDNKLSLNYEVTPHTVKKTFGGDVEVTNDDTGKIYRRNVVHLKKIEGKWTVADKKGEDEADKESETDSDS